MDRRDDITQDLTMALMFLTSWTERPGELRRCWKGYDFDDVNALSEQGLITGSRGAKSAYLTEEGVERARRVLSRYGIPFED
ncbi:MAG: transposase [Chloroflexi bacterium]|nr:transposase [Chloroflexota bacterium]